MATRRLLIFPCELGLSDGYSIAATADAARLAPGPEDVVVCRTHAPTSAAGPVRTLGMPTAREKAWNILRGRAPYEVSVEAMKACLAGIDGGFDDIFAGEIFFYPALRRLFPQARIRVRSHNFFSLARARQLLTRPPSSFRHDVNMRLHSPLEGEVLRDKRATLILITEEELAFAKLLFPLMRGECWPVVAPDLEASPVIRPPSAPRLVFLGSAGASHTAVGLEMTCRQVVPALRARVPAAEFHLFGRGSESYDAPDRGIHGHGRFPGDGLPFDGDGLFCVPDIHGCGIKLKVADLLKAAVPFISTPLGMSGYRIPAHPHILVEELPDWPEALYRYFQQWNLG
ncbi:hypothetical protein [Geothrix sp. 21YS21S-4]|uniref:hypothetical protein n=1 Tax=Geothrix sp. 21YS21S-4 TaxID=3068889 RepID=UPI0027BA92D2|nr:hypothetical protein [Geothrix sp. 21YS21S-4]